ncbi:uncharacterized protein HD556DRAFT_1438227 [Suillus plorans]|uniref:Uncharacterized protein n=1 Tax=Suillus plorans TaxID=116603 RepID=A0A9P7DSX0_9AGAM|nr:uncharacterized protein HD556DRAFT_1438227 [Suillus plorans]KAG1802181.1 hypothetical protein HD556DRAFT_1438227 [Suillus plorans]
MSMPSSTTRNTTSASSSDYIGSPTPQTSLPVDQFQGEIESLQSDAMSRHDSKHKQFLAKLEVKSEHHHETKKYEWIRSTREHEVSQAASTIGANRRIKTLRSAFMKWIYGL